MDKVERDGKVAVLVSPGFGAGWSTWAHETDLRDWALFAPEVVAWVEGGKVGSIDAIVKAKHGERYFYTGGADQLQIAWLPKGALFQIGEYDGAESVEASDEQEWSVA